MPSIYVDQLVTDESAQLSLTVLASRRGLKRKVTVATIQRPGLPLAGYAEPVHPERAQVLGATELGYLKSLPEERAEAGIRNLLQQEPACIVITRGLPAPPVLLSLADQRGIPVLGTHLESASFIHRLSQYLEDQLAPVTAVHGVLLDVLGVGILLHGKSGIGKSEVALDLVMRGHRLVADDIVDIRKKPTGGLVGSSSDVIQHHMEIRGLGIINVKDLFGISAVRDSKKIELFIELVEWRDEEDYDRLGTEEKYTEILDVPIPQLRIPVRPGRNITSIVEVAARNQLLKFQGHHSAKQFQEKLDRAIADARPHEFIPGEVE